MHKTNVLALSVFLFTAAPLAAQDAVDYAKQIKPLLKERCFTCHGALKQKAKLRLDTVQAMRDSGAIVPGKDQGSPLIQRITSKDDKRMPPPSEGDPLTAAQVELLRQWIRQGAKGLPNEKPEPDPRDHWAFRKPVRPRVPIVKNPAWVRNPIDAFIAEQHDKHGLTPLPEAPKGLLLRRVYVDLIGLPPTREELHEFLADKSPDAYEKVVDRLLASPHYGERWGRHWMDVWRYSDWYGRRHVPDVWNSAPQIWRWRDWIIQSLNDDKGYDRMIQEMLAADEIAPEDDDALVATGYIVRNWYALNPHQWKRDMVEHTGKAFLGLTFNCAHCHDHKYDPISQEEYFRFRAFFEPLELRQDRVPGEGDSGVFQKYDYSVLRKIAKLGAVRVFDDKLDAKTQMYIGGDERNVMKDRAPVKPGAPAFLFGDRLKIEPIELPLTAYYPALKPFAIKEEMAQREKELAAAKEARAKKITDDPFRLDKAQRRLEYYQANVAAAKAGKVHAPLGFIYPKTSSGRRKALAEWIANKDNPLTARVAVNHIWLRHFDRALVETVFDFGRNGKTPSHPGLLDWLAVELMEKGWRMQHLHRLVVTSATYRMSSAYADSANVVRDADNRWYWRANAKRMEAEIVRDSIMASAGELDRRIGGMVIENKDEATSKRRGLYFSVFPEDGGALKFLEIFDAPDPCDCYRRSSSVMPQQALALTNSQLAIQQSRVLARKLSAKQDDAAFIVAAFEHMLSRSPTEKEATACREFMQKQVELYLKANRKELTAPAPGVIAPSPDPVVRARESLVRVLYNHNDFITVR